MKKVEISFEFFPPKTPQALEKLLDTAKALAAFNPSFFSVTYGAGGSTREKTAETVKLVKSATGVTTVPHIAGLGSTRAQVDALLQRYQSENINRLVVLRGDKPRDAIVQGDFEYAFQLVDYIRKTTHNHFHISVACYPEYHPESSSPNADIDNLKRKIDAGANCAITQYFFNPESYFYFRDECERCHINTPIIAGIMPITNIESLTRFSALCGAEIPLWIQKHLQVLQSDKSAIVEFGKTVMIQFCKRLIQNGAPGLHFYTLNNTHPTVDICEKLNYY